MNATPPVELLVLDVHGVLLNRPFVRLLAHIARSSGEPLGALRERWRRELRAPAWRGEIDDDTLWHRLSGARESADVWSERLERLVRRRRAANELARWRTHVPIWLLTNHRTHWLTPRLERMRIRPHVDRVLVSDRIGALKPEPRAFAPIVDHGVDPRSIVFVDDQQRNLEAAERLGCRVVSAAGPHWVTTVDAWLAAGAATTTNRRVRA